MGNMVSLTLWYMWRSFINALKRHWKLFLGLILFAVALVCLFIFVESREKDKIEQAVNEQQSAQTEKGDVLELFGGFALAEDEEGRMLFFENGVCYEIKPVMLVEILAAFIILLLLAIGVRNGAKNGVNIFTMADVNFLFPSPNKPQSVLMFRMLAQIGVAIVGSAYFIFQMPNMVNSGMLSWLSGVMLLVGYIFVTIAANYLGILSYLVLNKHPKLKHFVEKYGIPVALLFPVLLVGALHFVFGVSVFNSVHGVFCGTVSRCIPLWGWLKYYAVLCVQENVSLAGGVLEACVVFVAVLMKFCWQLKVDFYEDALTYATLQQESIDRINNQSKGGVDYGRKHESGRDEKRWERRRNKSVAFAGFEGAKVFFAKTLLNRRRMYHLWGLLSPSFCSYMAYGGGLYLAMYWLGDSMPPTTFLLAYLAIVFFGMFFGSYMNPIQMDMGTNFIHMIPEKPSVIIFWDMLGYLVSSLLDYLPLLLWITLFVENIELGILGYLLVVSMQFYYGMIALLIPTVIKGYLPTYLSNVSQIILRLLPIAAAAGLLYLWIQSEATMFLEGPFLVFILCNIVISSLAFIPCSLCFHRGTK